MRTVPRQKKIPGTESPGSCSFFIYLRPAKNAKFVAVTCALLVHRIALLNSKCEAHAADVLNDAACRVSSKCGPQSQALQLVGPIPYLAQGCQSPRTCLMSTEIARPVSIGILGQRPIVTSHRSQVTLL